MELRINHVRINCSRPVVLYESTKLNLFFSGYLWQEIYNNLWNISLLTHLESSYSLNWGAHKTWGKYSGCFMICMWPYSWFVHQWCHFTDINSQDSNVHYVHYGIFVDVCGFINVGQNGYTYYYGGTNLKGVIPGATAEIHCHDGYKYNADNKPVCLDGGRWSKKIGQCKSNLYLLCMPLLRQW